MDNFAQQHVLPRLITAAQERISRHPEYQAIQKGEELAGARDLRRQEKNKKARQRFFTMKQQDDYRSERPRTRITAQKEKTKESQITIEM